VNCPKCGTPHSNVTATRRAPHGVISRRRRCYNGHAFTTWEVLPTSVARRELERNHQAAKLASKTWRRDQAIIRDTRPSTQVALDHGITDTRVRQIRGAHRAKAAA